MTPFINQKCTYEKVPKIWAGPSVPLTWTKFKRTAVFPHETDKKKQVSIIMKAIMVMLRTEELMAEVNK